MKRIGKTSAGSVLVEMTAGEFEALQQILHSASAASKERTLPESAAQIPISERASYVAERLKKLLPKRKDSLIRSIETMFQFTGGIKPAEIEDLITTLQKQGCFTIDAEGRVTFSP